MGCITERTSTPFNFISAQRVKGVNVHDTDSDLTFCVLVLPTPVLSITALLESEIQLNWIDSNSFVTGFEIERSINGSAFSLIHTALATDASFNDLGLTLNDTVAYRIRTCDGTLKSLYSNEVSFELIEWIIQGGVIISGGVLYPDEILN